ncbi:hypothetical protein ACJ72_07813 [Emergomyces africanus]|uniref:Uncharacterized protein n=1 Tax=Emergomyces africanus TaxID=1955775 RepID=A0A1B7NM36_9EURO|nr:hypothetical protein ACJ72_07813 [Emergomyces africanus]
MTIFTYNIIFSESVDVSFSPQLHAVHPLKNATSEMFADFSELSFTISDFDDINWNE